MENGQSRAESSDTVRAKTSQEKLRLRRRLKAVSDVDEMTLDGRLFHMCEAATRNLRSPMVECMVEWRIGGTM